MQPQLFLFLTLYFLCPILLFHFAHLRKIHLRRCTSRFAAHGVRCRSGAHLVHMWEGRLCISTTQLHNCTGALAQFNCTIAEIHQNHKLYRYNSTIQLHSCIKTKQLHEYWNHTIAKFAHTKLRANSTFHIILQPGTTNMYGRGRKVNSYILPCKHHKALLTIKGPYTTPLKMREELLFLYTFAMFAFHPSRLMPYAALSLKLDPAR